MSGPSSILPETPKGAKKQSLCEAALLFASLYLPGMLWPGVSLGWESAAFGLRMAQFVTAALPQALLLLYLLWVRGPAPGQASIWREFGIPRPRAVDLAWSLALAGGVFLLLGLLLLALSRLGVARQFLESGFRWRLSDARLLPMAVLFSLLAGYREELFFRSYLLVRFAQIGLHPAAAIAASSLLFACGHLYQGPFGFSVALLLGVYFALAFLRLRNLHRVAWAHALYNAAVLAGSLLLERTPLLAPSRLSNLFPAP